jgi:virulence factor
MQMVRKGKAARRAPARKRRIKLALIGAGNMANRNHYPSLAERADVEMAALCDLVPEKLTETADRFDIPLRYADYRRMLDEVKPDAVYCLMPPQQVFGVAADVLQRGRHLFIEKPPGINAFQARMLARLAKQNKCLSLVGFNRRYAPLSVMAKQRLDATGGVQLCRSVFHKGGPVAYYDGAIDAFTCDAVHMVDFLRFMAGEPERLEAAVTNFPHAGADADVPNSWQSLIRFENGSVGELSAYWASPARWLYFEMHNPHVCITCELEEAMVVRSSDGKVETFEAKRVANSDEMRVIGGYKQENDHFIDCLKAGKQPASNLADAAKSMQLAENIWCGEL